MIGQLGEIIESAEKREKKEKGRLKSVDSNYKKSAANLFHYRELRGFDLRGLQQSLGHLGLSRLAKSQMHVMASLQSTYAIIKAIHDDKPIKNASSTLSFKEGIYRINGNTSALLGRGTKGRRTRIMVTMPSVAADDAQLVEDMLKAGMNCARINCAHDGPEIWERMIKHIRRASKKLDKLCKIAMDLAGPKIRTGMIKPGPGVIKLRPEKDVYGRVAGPLKVWLGPNVVEGMPHVPMAEKDLAKLKGLSRIYFVDTRDKRRSFEIVEKCKHGYFVHCDRTTFMGSGVFLYRDKKCKKKILTVGEVPPTENPIVLKPGDKLWLHAKPLAGENAVFYKNGKLKSIAHVSCTAPSIFQEVKKGQRILFDDGKIEGKIEGIDKRGMTILIVHADAEGSKLRADKGINLPDTKLTISGLTEKDKKDLPFVVEHADVVNFSFVNRPQDVRDLHKALTKLNAFNKLGVVLKIETKTGYNQLTNILLEAMKNHAIGVMIARGDLAVESGWKHVGQAQEEILSICQAAHVPVVWATQVLEGLAKKRLPSRAEITDAVMSQRADCVMLNKGPHIVEAIGLLHDILTSMEPFVDRNKALTPKMKRL